MKVKFSATTHDRINSVPIENGQVIAILDQPGYYYDFSGTRYSITPPAAVSQLTNDLGFITNAVDDLTNYYDKDEVDTLIGSVASLDIQVVDSLPTTDISTTTIYLVPTSDPGQENVKDEYINTTGTSAGWEQIGSTSVDLSDYVTQSDLSSTLSDYVTYSDMNGTLESYVESYDFEELRDNVEQNYLLKYNSDQYSESIQKDTSSDMVLNSASTVSITSDDTISLNSGYTSSIELHSDASLNINASTVSFGSGYTRVDAVNVNASTFSVSTTGGSEGINLTQDQFGVLAGNSSIALDSSGAAIHGSGKVVIDNGTCSGPTITLGSRTSAGSTIHGVFIEGRSNPIYLMSDSEQVYIQGNSAPTTNLFDVVSMFTSMCPIETGSTASKAYQKGDIFYYQNNLLQATANIALGDPLSSASVQTIYNLGEAMRYIVSLTYPSAS